MTAATPIPHDAGSPARASTGPIAAEVFPTVEDDNHRTSPSDRLPRLLAVGGLLALPLIAWGLPSQADDRLNLRGTTITLQPTTRPGAVAEVVMRNLEVNGEFDEGQATLDLGWLQVVVSFDWNMNAAGHDAVTVTVTDGYLYFPSDCVLVVPETATGTMWIYALEGVGM